MGERRRAKEILRVGSKEVVRLLGAAAYAALFFAPHAANHTLQETEVLSEIVGFPVDLSFNPGSSQVDVLNIATIYSDKTAGDIGAKVEVQGLPRFSSATEVGDYFSKKRIAAYSSMLGSPDEVATPLQQELITEAKSNALDFELLFGGIGAGILYGGSLLLSKQRRINQLEGKDVQPMPALYVIGLGTMALAGSFAVADHHYNEWLESSPMPSNASTIHALDSTSLKGTQIDNPAALDVANRIVTYTIKLDARRDKERQEFLNIATPNLIRELPYLVAPNDDEEIIVTTTDIHGSKAGTELATSLVTWLNERYGVNTVIDQGDKLYSDLQAGVLKNQAAIAGEDGTFATTTGNHDIGNTEKLAEEAGMVNLDGIKDVNGMKLYGRPDPQVTPFFGSSYFPDPEKNEAWLGGLAYEETKDERVDSISLHQPLAIQALLGIDSITSFLNEEGVPPLTVCKEDGIRDINSSLVNGGHHHDQYPIKLVCNSDGTWTVINIQGTTGGAEEQPTPNRWSDPEGKPIKEITMRVFYRNTEYGSITGYADVVVQPDGNVNPIIRHNIGTTDGAPFPTDLEAKKRLLKAKKAA